MKNFFLDTENLFSNLRQIFNVISKVTFHLINFLGGKMIVWLVDYAPEITACSWFPISNLFHV